MFYLGHLFCYFCRASTFCNDTYTFKTFSFATPTLWPCLSHFVLSLRHLSQLYGNIRLDDGFVPDGLDNFLTGACEADVDGAAVARISAPAIIVFGKPEYSLAMIIIQCEWCEYTPNTRTSIPPCTRLPLLTIIVPYSIQL